MRYQRTTFLFSQELGARLRHLRKRQGLSLRRLAVLMARPEPGTFTMLARLERGKVAHPSVSLLADYLRACGTSISELADLFDSYTLQKPLLYELGDQRVAELLQSLPPAERRALLRWEQRTSQTDDEQKAAGHRLRKGRIVTPEERVRRIVRSFIQANWNEVLEQKLYTTLVQLGSELPKSERRRAAAIGRRFFRILTRHYASKQRRRLALNRAEQRARDDGLPAPVVTAMLTAATQAHSELQLSGRLDWKPTEEQIVQTAGRAPQVEKAETRLEREELQPQTEYNKAAELVRLMMRDAGDAYLEKLHLDFATRRHYLNWFDRLFAIAIEHGTDSAAWQAEIARAAPGLHDPTVASAVAQVVAQAFNIWKKRLPPKPTS